MAGAGGAGSGGGPSSGGQPFAVTGGNVFERAQSAMGNSNAAATAAAGYQPMMVGAQMIDPSAVQGMLQQNAEVASNYGYTPQQVAAGQYDPAQLSQASIGQYMNPYTNQVVDVAMRDLQRAQQIQQMQAGADATAAGAFGGSRHGIMEAETNRAFADAFARQSAGLRQAGFQNAQQAALADIGARNRASEFNIGNSLQAQLANQQAGLQNAQFGSAQDLRAQLANQGQGYQNAALMLQAQQANQNAGLQSQLANQRAGLAQASNLLNASNAFARNANLGFGMGQGVNQNLMQQGTMQQALQQRLMDAARGQFQNFQQAPMLSLGAFGQALGATPVPQTTTNTRQPGLFDYLTMGASMFSF